ncbi:MAG: hypothetical protein IPM80_10720 [Proteobacteria bacterium]|nr:hypothetical protein [Pseudomonadota bacterium]
MNAKLLEQLPRYPSPPHLLSSGDDGRPHAVAVTVRVDGNELVLRAGKRSLANVSARKLVSVLWGAPSADDYSLIVDGEARVSGNDAELRITITRAVLHRPGAPRQATGSTCGSDCVPLI